MSGPHFQVLIADGLLVSLPVDYSVVARLHLLVLHSFFEHAIDFEASHLDHLVGLVNPSIPDWDLIRRNLLFYFLRNQKIPLTQEGTLLVVVVASGLGRTQVASPFSDLLPLEMLSFILSAVISKRVVQHKLGGLLIWCGVQNQTSKVSIDVGGSSSIKVGLNLFSIGF